MSSVKSISRNSVFLALSQVIEKVLSLLMAILLARYLGKGDYGRLVYALSFASLFTFFWDFGLVRLITRDVAKDRSHASAAFSSKFKIQVASCLAWMLALSLYLLVFEQRGPEVILIFILGMSAAFNHLSNSFRSIFIAFERAEYESFLNLVLRSFLLLAIFLTITFRLGLLVIALVLLLFSILTLIGSWKLVERNFLHFEFRERRRNTWPIIKDSLPIAIIIALTTFYLQINKILLLK